MPKITEILFDCDNTLVLSEELAFEACADLSNEILSGQGITDRYTGEQLLNEFVGQNFRGMMNSLMKKYNFELPQDKLDYYVDQEMHAVIAKLEAKAKPCVGATEELEKLSKAKKYGMAVVSSSAYPRVLASVKKVGQDKYFTPPEKLIFSAATSLEKPTTKPDPAIYLHACKKLGVKPEECVAVEDSKSGAGAATRAKIPCIAYVGSYHTKQKQEEIAKALLDLGCKNVMWKWSEFEKCLAEIEAM